MEGEENLDIYVYDADSHDGAQVFLQEEFRREKIKYLFNSGANTSWAIAVNHLANIALRYGAYEAFVVATPAPFAWPSFEAIAVAAREQQAVVSPIPANDEPRMPWALGRTLPTSVGRIRETGRMSRWLFATPPSLWSVISMPDDDGDPAIAFAHVAANQGYPVGYLEGQRLV